jgi:flagellar motility protein MotE (MotC chaperone)
MIRFVRDLRLIPIALIASACLLVLKAADIFVHSAYFAANYNVPVDSEVSVIRPMADATEPPGAMLSWAKQMFNFPDGRGSEPMPSRPPIVAAKIAPQATSRLADLDGADITGSVPENPGGDAKKAQDKTAPDKTAPDKNAADSKDADPRAAADPKLGGLPVIKDGRPGAPTAGAMIPTDGMPSGAERAILERLQQRRQELDSRARELDIRESLIQGAEKRMEARLTELKETEERIKVETQEKNDADAARLKGLITMYENMKPRDAAKIFNGLDSGVLLQVASAMNPRTMAEIMAQMSAEVAQRLTVELASKAQQARASGPEDLPKIEGQPTAQ